MHSMTAALAAHTLTPADQPTPAETGWFATLWNWSVDHVPGGGITVLAALGVLGFIASNPKGRTALLEASKGLWSVLVTLSKAIWSVLRFYGGYETRGEARSDAGFLRAGTRLIHTGGPAPVALGSVAFAPPRVSLVKPRRRRPSARARRAADWLIGYQGRAAKALHVAVQVALAVQWVVARAFRIARAVGRAVRAVYGAVAPVVTAVALVLRMWHRWPYAVRGLARLALTAAAVGLFVPAWRTRTSVLLVVALVVVVAVAQRWKPKAPGDDVVYGPRIWTLLREDLGLPEDEIREHWLQLPAKLSEEGARIVLRLPWTFRGSQGEKDTVTALINSRIPGEWVGRYQFTGDHATALYTHKPPPKPPAPEPEPPAAVNIWDPKVQEILATLGPDEFYLGQDTFDRPIIQKMSDEQAHWALSVGSGGGKSAFLQWLAIQMLMKGGTIIGIDPKMVSLTPLIGITGIHLYGNPQAPQDMRATLEWVVQVVNARNYEKKHKTRTEFLPLYVFLEECNQLADILKEEYTSTKESGAPAGDPIWRDAVASTLRLGREVNVHIIAVFQDFKDTQFGGVSLVPLFPFKILGSYREQQWKRIMGASFPMPPIQKKAGRMVLVTDTGDVTRIQTPYAPWNPDLTKDENQKEAYRLLTAYYKQLRDEHGYSADGLYVAPPAASPEVAPALLRRLSRDTAPQGPNVGSEGGMSDETAGHAVTHQGGVTADVTGLRDRLRLIPGQAAGGAHEDALAAPVLLNIAEIAREMKARGYDIEAGLIRQHKRRKDSTGFPEGVETADGEKYTLGQLVAFYEKRGLAKREEEQEAMEGDVI
ncbi:hypothetical protein OG906_43540 (plasmid) [Streptomyces sp. NBC_01426]|uniref:hypothetical protein n=1 Tax=Streptomyces sp. NBC_01426 TaxID=2975866 RepID=UPI002E30B944|nr:hypothetical protein [Streptomyces sp. NBC_01426]